MARNVEIKAYVTDMEALAQRAASIADAPPVEIFQDDTFFHCANGRMKLRILSEHEGQLVFYRRPDQSAPKESYYLVTKTSEPALYWKH